LISRVGVVIPAHDEQDVIGACLTSVLRACRYLTGGGVLVEVVVVLDRCQDATAELVAGFDAHPFPVRSICSDRPGVGRARATGVQSLIDRHGAHGLWICTTDADSTVPADWIARQLRHAAAGADAIAGTVEVVDWAAQPARVMHRYRASYRSEPGHRHVHGANLSFTAATYLDSGGFADVLQDEDVGLLRRIGLLGRTVVAAADLPVITSARSLARAPGGFASYLTSLHQLPADELEVDDVVC
jgi:glycosyltransferase involved in cell wall biosynthesis